MSLWLTFIRPPPGAGDLPRAAPDADSPYAEPPPRDPAEEENDDDDNDDDDDDDDEGLNPGRDLPLVPVLALSDGARRSSSQRVR